MSLIVLGLPNRWHEGPLLNLGGLCLSEVYHCVVCSLQTRWLRKGRTLILVKWQICLLSGGMFYALEITKLFESTFSLM